MKRDSQTVRIDIGVLRCAKFISEQTGLSISELVEQACREAFGWYLKGGKGILTAQENKQ